MESLERRGLIEFLRCFEQNEFQGVQPNPSAKLKPSVASEAPKVSVGIVSWSRLHYLRATLESARRCIEYSNLEWIVVDNESEEAGVREYLESLGFLDYLSFRRQSHAAAMNEIVEVATGDYLLLWPDDVQFVVEGPWLGDFVKSLAENPWMGSVALDGQRRSTLDAVLHPRVASFLGGMIREVRRRRRKVRWPRRVETKGGWLMYGCGWGAEGVVGSGIPSLTRRTIWQELGPWQAEDRLESRRIEDSSLGAEEEMVVRFERQRLPYQRVLPELPVAADIITDPLGAKAKNRGTLRYGVYMPPQQGDLYYEVRDQADLTARADRQPWSFSELARPLGFRLPCDENGDRLKASINLSVVETIEGRESISAPLGHPEVRLGPTIGGNGK